MKDYNRLTERRDTPLVVSMWAGVCESLKIYNRLAELENKIERGEIDYVSDRDKEIARLIAENQRLREEAAEQKSIAEHEHATQMEWFRIAGDYKAENAELRERLEQAVELPYMYEAELVDSAGHFFKTIYVVLYNNNGTIRAIQYSYKKVAEARLKVLQGGER